MTYQELPLSTKIKIKMICNRNNITKPSDIETAYNNYVEGRDIFEGLSEDYQRVSAFDNYLANGGHIYSGEEENTQQMENASPNIFQRPNGSYFYQVPGGEEIDVTPINTLSEDNSKWTYTDASGRIYNPVQGLQNSYSLTEAENADAVERAINNYTRELAWRAKDDPSSIALQGKYTMPLILSPALGKGTAMALANPYVDAGLTSYFGAEGLQDLANGKANWQTTLEIAPMGRAVKPLYEGVVQPSMKLLNSPLTGNWTKIGNKEYRFKPGYLGMNGSPIESKPVIEGFEEISVPEGFSPIRVINQNTRNGSRTVHLVKDNSTGKFKILEDMKFKSELDWSPTSWYEDAAGRGYKDGSLNEYNDRDIKTLESHVPEYHEIERKAKQDGTWLKMPDGSIWEGDPRSWVQSKSKAYQEAAQNQEKEIFWVGRQRKESDPNFKGRLWSLPAANQSKVAPAKARTYASEDSKVMPMFTVKYENPEAITVVDANGADWHAVPYKGGRKTTDAIVDDIFSNPKKKAAKINNVLDTGEYTVPSDSKYYYEGIGNDKRVSQNNMILNENVFRKALLGGNGDFKHPTHMYRSLFTPLTLGVGYLVFNELNENR